MPQKPQPEKNESGEEVKQRSKNDKAFRALTERLLVVSPDELKDKEKEWKEGQLREN
jgi:hypothetical protein